MSAGGLLVVMVEFVLGTAGVAAAAVLVVEGVRAAGRAIDAGIDRIGGGR